MTTAPPIDMIDSATEWPELADFLAETGAIGSASPRAQILVSAGMMEKVLIRMLKTFLIDSPITESLVGDKPQAPLGTFAARTMAAQALGLITENEAKSLKIIREIRNEYAHRMNSEINTESVKSRVKNLCEMLPFDQPKAALAAPTPASQFSMATVFLGMALMVKIRAIAKRRCEPIEKHLDMQGISFPFAGNLVFVPPKR